MPIIFFCLSFGFTSFFFLNLILLVLVIVLLE